VVVGSETSCSETLLSFSSVTCCTGAAVVVVEAEVVNLFLLFCLLKLDLQCTFIIILNSKFKRYNLFKKYGVYLSAKLGFGADDVTSTFSSI